jgi:hypothetical protein
MSDPNPVELDQVAARMKEILNQKGPDGAYLYSNIEVRDFICVAVFELGIPMEGRVKDALAHFFTELKVPAGSTKDDVLEDIRSYFVAHPLNPRLLAEFAAFGRSKLLENKEGFKDAAVKAREVAALHTAGVQEELRAPAAAKAPAATTPKPKRGLSKK